MSEENSSQQNQNVNRESESSFPRVPNFAWAVLWTFLGTLLIVVILAFVNWNGISDVYNKVDNLATSVDNKFTNLEKKVDEGLANLAKVSEGLTKANSKLEEVDKEVQNIATGVKGLQTYNQERDPSWLKDRIGDLESRKKVLEGNLKSVSKKIKNNKVDYDGIRWAKGGIPLSDEDSVESAKRFLERQGAEKASIEAELGEINSKLKRYRELLQEIRRIPNQLNKVQKSVGNNTAEIGSLNTSVSGLKTSVEEVLDRLGAVEISVKDNTPTWQNAPAANPVERRYVSVAVIKNGEFMPRVIQRSVLLDSFEKNPRFLQTFDGRVLNIPNDCYTIRSVDSYLQEGGQVTFEKFKYNGGEIEVSRRMIFPDRVSGNIFCAVNHGGQIRTFLVPMTASRH